jgi:hypothetical protein
MSGFARVRVAIAVVALTFGLLLGAPPARVAAACGVSSICATLYVAFNGDGAATAVTEKNGVPDGKISCSRSGGVTTGTCSYTYAVTFAAVDFDLHVIPDPGTSVCYLSCFPESQSEHWTGTLSDTSGNESFTFNLVEGTRTVSLTVAGTGSGRISSVPDGINCSTSGGTCAATFTFGTTVFLTAKADSGSTFEGWPKTIVDGPCVPGGAAAICELDLIYSGSPPGFTNPAITIAFTTAPTRTPSPTPTPRATPSPTPRPTVTPTASGSPAPGQTAAGSASPTPSSAATPTDGGAGFVTEAQASPPSPKESPAAVLTASGPSDGPPPWLAPAVAAVIAALIMVGIAFTAVILRRRDRPPG